MKTNVNVVAKANGLYRVEYRGKTISDNLRDKMTAELNAHHFRHAPSLVKTLGLKRRDGILKGRPFWGAQVEIEKTESGNWELRAEVDGSDRGRELFKTRQAALEAVCRIGREKMTTRNMLNPEAGEIEISRSEKGGCCDPATETYWSM